MSYFPPSVTPSQRMRRLLDGPSPVYASPPAIGMQADRIYLHGLDIPCSPELAEEAWRLIERLHPLLRPFGDKRRHAEAVGDILDTVNASVRNPMDAAAIEAKAQLLMVATYNTPELAFCANVSVECIRTFKFFPAIAEIIEVLDRQMQPLRDTIARLNIIRIKAAMA